MTVASMDGKRVFGLSKPASWPGERISADPIAVDMANSLFTMIFSRGDFIEGVKMRKPGVSLKYTGFAFLTVRVQPRRMNALFMIYN